jgi:hypothetical protein
LGTFLHSKLGSGHLAQAGHGGHFSFLPVVGHTDAVGHAGHTGGTISDFNIYKSSWPRGIMFLGIPWGKELSYFPELFAELEEAGVELGLDEVNGFSKGEAE